MSNARGQSHGGSRRVHPSQPSRPPVAAVVARRIIKKGVEAAAQAASGKALGARRPRSGVAVRPCICFLVPARLALEGSNSAARRAVTPSTPPASHRQGQRQGLFLSVRTRTARRRPRKMHSRRCRAPAGTALRLLGMHACGEITFG